MLISKTQIHPQKNYLELLKSQPSKGCFFFFFPKKKGKKKHRKVLLNVIFRTGENLSHLSHANFPNNKLMLKIVTKSHFVIMF